uniref:Uncharacterized protein n=1 Tax=Timema poppense TaxID=170557 RepID=A0A7R9D145_TIMPO|nr:unnamed protein product [Timema poppensis]
MMDGGTGLTPVSAPLIPSCSSQQRNSVAGGCVVLSSPDSVPPKLVSLCLLGRLNAYNVEDLKSETASALADRRGKSERDHVYREEILEYSKT